LFSGDDASGQTGLWGTDGTVAGTHELTGIAGAPTTGKGLDPLYLTVFNGQALFEGRNSSGQLGLWETDGTGAGTHELTGIAGAASAGLSPFGLTVLNGQALFGGRDSSGQIGLWETDGTVAGTKELTGIAGAQITGSGLDPSNITAYNGEALFSGYNSSGKLALWETNGTAAGTHELTGIVGASTASFAPSDLIAIATGPKVTAGANVGYVAGAAPVTLDAGLTVTDAAAGSLAAATVSISAGFVQGDTLSVGSPQTGITSSYNAATGVLALSGAAGLAAYQTELDSITYAYPQATTSSRTISWSVNDGVNASNPVTSSVSVSRIVPVVTAGANVGYVAGAAPVTLDAGLTVTDAAAASLAAATVSISAGFAQGDMLSVGSPQTGITSSYNAATGVLALSGAASLAAYQTELDSITYASPQATASSRTISWSVNDGVNASNPVTSSVSVSPAPHPDPTLSGPNLSVMLQNIGGQLALWQVNGSTISASQPLGPNPGASWLEKGVGAFFSGDTSDILLQNANGQAAIWEVNGSSLIGGGTVSPNPGPSWKAIGTGDFYGDGHSDILWQKANGQTSIWEMNGNQVIGGGAVSANPGPAWNAIGTGDFNGDGHSDILWQNANGQVSVWEMNGNNLVGGGAVSPNPGPNWKAIGTGDFNGDGLSDILFQNTTSGQVSIWEMNGNNVIGGGAVSANPGPAWRAIGTDHGSDILFQNASGQISTWDMNGTNIVGGAPVSSNPGSSWRAVGLA
jgi:hypothetical protein